MIILIGKSGSGKSTIERIISNQYGYKRIISFTTREKRKNETDGVEYNFITKQKFDEMFKNDEFLEYVEYNGNYYGAAKKDFTKNSIIVVEPVGFKIIKENLSKIKLNPDDVKSFYIDVNKENRILRMANRGDSIESVTNRIKNDEIAFEGVEYEVDYVIDNNNYSTITNYCIQDIVKYILSLV